MGVKGKEIAETGHWLRESLQRSSVRSERIEWLRKRQAEKGALGCEFQFRAILRAIRELEVAEES